VFKNKSDISGCMTEDEIVKVRKLSLGVNRVDIAASSDLTRGTGSRPRYDQDTYMEDTSMQCNDRFEFTGRHTMGRPRRERSLISVLSSDIGRRTDQVVCCY